MNYTESEHKFFGRTKILNLLKRRVVDLKEGYRQNIAFLGLPYVGKSTILHHFVINLDDPDVTVIYLDLENKDFRYFFSKFIGSLLYNYSKNKQLPLYDDINLLLTSTEKFIPQTVQVIRKLQADLIKDKTADLFQGLLVLPEIFTNETGKFCVLILDEFQNLEDFGIANAFQDLGKKIMTQKKCFYILSSSFPSLAKKIVSEKLSLLFGNFEVVDVEAFDLQTSQEFIEYSLKEKRIGIQLRSFITDFTGGHPLYLNLICQELKNLSAIHNQSEVYMPIVTQAIENTIFDRWGVVSRHFELVVSDLCSGKGNRMISSIFISLANGKHKIEEIVADLSIPRTQIHQKILRLLEQGIIVKNGNFYYFKDKLLKFWIKYVYQKRLRDVELSPDKQRKQFKEEFNKLIESFKLSSRKDFSSRIVELLHCFDNESFDLNGRRYKLPIFRSFEPIKIKSDNGLCFDVIKASTQDTIWFVVTKKDNFVETDINFVLSELKKIGQKPERCLLVCLSDLDVNARLKALQERFWIWNEGELNTLLTLFDQPFIV